MYSVLRKSILLRINNWFVFILLTIIVAAFAISSNYLINHLREKETGRIKSFAMAMKIYQENTPLHSDVQDLLLAVVTENDEIPVIITDKNKTPIIFEGNFKNIPEEIKNNPKKLKAKISEMEKVYKPFEIQLPQNKNQLVFYDNSQIINSLRYYPYALALSIGVYLFFSFSFFRTLKKTNESLLWAGLAKETAHQIGTPLSSLIGWIEIMKLENEITKGITEMERDVNRLKIISERFSKIGSIPELNELNLKETLQQNYDYLKLRISSKIDFKLQLPKEEILAPHSKILISWVVENLVKNAVDAMKGTGKLEISLYKKNKNIIIDFKDSGCGMTNYQIRKAFNAGFSTKKRGWGLGLSLTKRVINEYHKGDIKIAESEIGKGTTFRIMLNT